MSEGCAAGTSSTGRASALFLAVAGATDGRARRTAGVVVADAGFRARLLADEDCGVVVRVVVPGQQPLAVRRLVRQRGVAVALGQGNVEADRERLGLVVVLAGEPAPGGGRAWADAGDQVRLAAEAGNDRLSRDCCALQSPFSGEVLDHPGGAVVSQVQHLGVVQLLFGGGDHHHPRARLAGFGKGGVAAVVEVQGFQFRLGRRSAPEQQGGTDDQHQGGDQENGASDVSRQTYQRFTNPVRPPAISAAVSARATSGSSPAGTAR